MLQAVLGAGCAGLVSARELVREGHRVQVPPKNALERIDIDLSSAVPRNCAL